MVLKGLTTTPPCIPISDIALDLISWHHTTKPTDCLNREYIQRHDTALKPVGPVPTLAMLPMPISVQYPKKYQNLFFTIVLVIDLMLMYQWIC